MVFLALLGARYATILSTKNTEKCAGRTVGDNPKEYGFKGGLALLSMQHLAFFGTAYLLCTIFLEEPIKRFRLSLLAMIIAQLVYGPLGLNMAKVRLRSRHAKGVFIGMGLTAILVVVYFLAAVWT